MGEIKKGLGYYYEGQFYDSDVDEDDEYENDCCSYYYDGVIYGSKKLDDRKYKKNHCHNFYNYELDDEPKDPYEFSYTY